MSDYFTYSPLTANTVARAADVNSRFLAVEAGFDLLPPPEYISQDRLTYADDTGAANAYISNPVIPITAYTAGLHLTLKALNANSGASTINVSGLGVKNIVRADGSALQTGDIVAGQILDLHYDGTAFRLSMAFAELSPAGVAAKLALAGPITVSGTITISAGGITIAGVTLDAPTAFGVSIVEAASAGAARSLLGLGTMATETAANYAVLASPALTGVPTAPTAAGGTNTTQIATTAFVQAAVTGGTYAPLNSPAFTGVPTAPTAAVDTNTTQIATTAYVVGQGYAKLASPTFTGVPLSTTPATADDSFKIATTAYVKANLTSYLTSANIAATYAPLNSPALTGNPTATTQAVDNNSTRIATTAYVIGQGYLKSTDAATTYLTQANAATTYLTQANATTTYAPKASPALTGTPTAPTAAWGDADTQIATTAFVDRLLDLPLIRSTATPTLALTDRGGVVEVTGATATIPANSSVAFPVGSTVAIYNNTASNVTLNITTDTLRWAGTASTGSRTIAQRGYAFLRKRATTEWTVSGDIS